MVDTKLVHEFTAAFDTEPSHCIHVPGRVNLIGEHTDYNGFPVLPVSIPHTITVTAAPRHDRTVHIKNIDTNYPAATFELSHEIPRSQDSHWANYVKAAAQALTAKYENSLRGMNAIYHGTIPGSAGLSSSSALVIATALALLASGNQNMEPLELAEIMADGERYVGTQGGGMDQAICLLGREDHAVRIDFFPLRCSYVKFPKDYSIVVAHSLIRAAKTENALLLYNRRPAECRLATAIINALFKPVPPITRLGDLAEKNRFKTMPVETGFKPVSTEDFVKNTFTRETYTGQDIAQLTGETIDTITEKYLLTRDGIPMPVPHEGFSIRQRALHVFSEAERVERSCMALEDNDIDAFGALMNESHESCDKLYGISTPELNALVSIMRNLGATGARLTGAGFGGCAIALVHDEKVRSFTDGIHRLYYTDYIKETHPELVGTFTFENIFFAVKPSGGATVKAL